ncbi:MAG TPA: helix-turn-helix transcriptional regulator [Armatimonadota bacterium]|nr:helix-turn-helix transcriptional regulator [Armatimonadota bacterium]
MNLISSKRKALGYTQAQLALLVGTDQSHISKIENAHIDPATSLALRIAKALGSSVEQLFSYTLDAADSAMGVG